MNINDIQKLRQSGEETKVQFKERILDKYDIACELVAYFGVLPPSDFGDIHPLKFSVSG